MFAHHQTGGHGSGLVREGEEPQVYSLEQKAEGWDLTGWYFLVYIKGMSSKPRDSP